MKTKNKKPRPNVWSNSYKPYGEPPPGIKGNPDDWAEAFRNRVNAGSFVIEEILGSDDPWSILGVAKNASKEEIKKAYRKRSMETHPDIHPDKDQSEFEKIQAAYEKLYS